MKIKEFSIIRYGILSDCGKIKLSNFNLFFGRNEKGKSLTIDALVKLLLKKNVRDFEAIERVEENPEGYVIVEDDRREEIKLPEKGTLLKFTGLVSSECRNVFIIRNSDLSISAESEFYTNVTDRLTGLKTEEITKIKEILKNLGKVTTSGVFRDIKDEKIKTKIEKAKDLIEKVTDLTKKIKEEKLNELEEEHTRCREEADSNVEQRQAFEDARKREKFEKGKQALIILTTGLKELNDLELFNEEDEKFWENNEISIKFHKEERERAFIELTNKEKELRELKKELIDRERSFFILQERKKIVENEIKPDIHNYEMKSRELVLKKSQNNFCTYALIATVIFTGISLLGIIVKTGVLFYGLAIVFSILTVLFGGLKFLFVKEKATLAEMFEKIRLASLKFKLDADDVKKIINNIQQSEEDFFRKQEDFKKIKLEKEGLENRIKEIKEEQIVEVEEKVKNCNKKIEGVKIKSGEKMFQKYAERFKLKLKQISLVGEQKSVLENLFGVKEKNIGDLEKEIDYWNGEISNLEKYKDRAKDIEYNENTVSKLKEERNLCEEKIVKLEGKLVHFQKRLEEIEREVNKVFQLESDYLFCKTSVDLEAVENKLQEFVEEKEEKKDTVIKSIEIFEEIEMEEREKVSYLFGKKSDISKFFNRITNGRYEEVVFNLDTGKIKVKRKDGVFLAPEKLSGGAYDQLYFSIRLVLGEKLLKGNKGFFIMDDPFIKADSNRLKIQLEMLKEISKWGWQCLYFTAKEEVRDFFKKDIHSGFINYFEV